MGCAEREYNIDVAHAALLAEMRRLHHDPWSVEAEQRLVGPADERAAEAAELPLKRRAADEPPS